MNLIRCYQPLSLAIPRWLNTLHDALVAYPSSCRVRLYMAASYCRNRSTPENIILSASFYFLVFSFYYYFLLLFDYFLVFSFFVIWVHVNWLVDNSLLGKRVDLLFGFFSRQTCIRRNVSTADLKFWQHLTCFNWVVFARFWFRVRRVRSCREYFHCELYPPQY